MNSYKLINEEARILLELKAKYSNYTFRYEINQGYVEKLSISGDDPKDLNEIIEFIRK